jgi:hypothetical protein
MAFVEIAHRRDKRHAQLTSKLIAQFFDRVNDFQ